MAQPITATIITLNEEHNVAQAVASALLVCDEVLVVDSGSADRTRELAEKAGAKVIVQPYLGDGPQKKHGVTFAKNDWILSLDADERLDAEAVKAINALDLSNSKLARYELKRKSYVGDVWIRLWSPDWLVRLYHRGRAGYDDSPGHASVGGGAVGRIGGHIIHYSYRDYADLVGRVKKFSARGAKQVIDSGVRVSPLDPPIHGVGAFIKHYLGRGGLFHGVDGLNVSVTAAYSSYMKYAIALEAQRRSAKGKK